MNDVPVPDPLHDLLTRPAPTEDAALRQTLLSKTTRVLRRRLYVRRCGQAAVLAACYLAGIFTTRGWVPPAAPPGSAPQVAATRPAPPNTEIASATEQNKSSDGDAWLVVAEESKRAEIYRQAGDRYLEERGDLTAAVHCYQHSLESASEADLEISTDDNFLLMALKDARQKEKRHVPNDG